MALNFPVDMADGYSGDHSQEMLGFALGNRDDVYIATKVGRHDAGWPAERFIRCVEDNLRRLRRA